MNNVQFITWKPIYWIQHLALSPLHLFFNTSAKKRKEERKNESKLTLIPKVTFGLYSVDRIHAAVIVLYKKVVITTTTFACSQLKTVGCFYLQCDIQYFLGWVIKILTVIRLCTYCDIHIRATNAADRFTILALENSSGSLSVWHLPVLKMLLL